MNSSLSRATISTIHIVLPAAAALLVLWATARYGIGVSPDSAHYIGAARNLVAGRGLQFNGEAFTHWPPLYPFALAASTRFGIDALQAARALAALLFASNVVLIVRLANDHSAGWPYPGLLAGAVFLLTPEVAHAHLMAWSEPLFYALSLVSVLLLLRWTRHRSRWLLVGAGALVGLAILTRFVGATLLPPFLAIILHESRRTRSNQRVYSAWIYSILFLAAAAIPLTPWLIWIASVPHDAADRAIQLHFPHTIQFAAIAVLTTAMAYGLWRQSVKHKDSEMDAFARWALTFGITYSIFLLFSITFIDALTPLDGRILSPLIAFGIPLAFRSKPRHTAQSGSSAHSPELSDRKAPSHPHPSAKSADKTLSPVSSTGGVRSLPDLRNLAVGAVILMTVLRLAITASVVRNHYSFGSGYTGAEWRDSPTLRWTDRIPLNVPIYSNAPDAIAFYGRAARSLPEEFSPTTLRANRYLDAQISQMNLALRQGARIVYFNRSSRRYLISADILPRRTSARLVQALPDGAIFGASPE